MESNSNPELLTQPLKNVASSNTLYGQHRLALSKQVGHILDELGIDWFIESGTLLGAWRNHKLLPNDDDFDIAIILDDQPIERQLQQINDKFNTMLTSNYQSRVVNTYCHKLEIFQPEYGNYILPDPAYRGANFHNVTVDLQVYCHREGGLSPLYYLYQNQVNIPLNDVYPLQKINLEGTQYNCPANTRGVLEILYGYLGPDYLFNVATRKYEKRDPEPYC